MNPSVYDIPVLNLALATSLIAVVFFIYWRWSLKPFTVVYAAVRMVVQLAAIGFVLVALFQFESALLMTAILAVMLTTATWIALRPLRHETKHLYRRALVSLFWGCVPTLFLIVFGVVRLHPWYEPRYFIPIAGMIFSNAMNSLSLAAERFHAERARNVPFQEARNVAFQASLLPTINSFFAVGIVSLPGMMTGQILAGVSPLIAVRYQIMVMCMLLGASGISSWAYLSKSR
ncbi:MAG: hypothetical protein A3A73_03410 [Omnitrophica bacterium RIFCSPLOWO2_01_FULL_50_24]|nr:MAG: hypothetical protein A3A73_03410 [Omnitrophica bacterium RIFCSPLOWO2_01_FULL_50_24]